MLLKIRDMKFSCATFLNTYLIFGFLTKPVLIKIGQRHVVFIPSFPNADSSCVRALWNPTAANLLELKEITNNLDGKLFRIPVTCDNLLHICHLTLLNTNHQQVGVVSFNNKYVLSFYLLSILFLDFKRRVYKEKTKTWVYINGNRLKNLEIMFCLPKERCFYLF